MSEKFDNQIRLKLLNLLKDNPALSQRDMKHAMGISLGKVNYCVSKLSEKGFIKIERFKNSKNKAAYLYKLTPGGLEELTKLTVEFLKLKMEEHDKIKEEIKDLSDQMSELNFGLSEHQNEISYLKEILKNYFEK